MNDHNTVQPTPHPPQHDLFVGAMATMATGYLIRMVEIGWDPVKGKKRLVRNPGEDWQFGPQLTQAQVMDGIRSGCNAYLYRLPDGVFVADADTAPAREALTAILGQPDVVTPRGGAHWLTTEQLAPQPGIDTDPRQLYGPGSFYANGEGATVAYVGAVPATARPLHPAMPRKTPGHTTATARPKAGPPSPGGALGEYLDQRTPHSTAKADAAIAAALDDVRAHPAQPGAGFRTALMRAAMTLGGYVGAGHLEHGDAVAELEGAVEAVWGQADSDDRLWIQQGLSDGAGRPFAVYDPVEQLFGSDAAAPEETARRSTFFDFIGREPFDPDVDDSDQGLADQVLERTQPGMRRAVDTGGWIVRGPERWEELKNEGRAEWVVSVLARLMPPGRKAAASEEKTDAHWQHERRAKFMSSKASAGVTGKMRAITGGADHPAVVRVGDLDADAEVLWAGGVPWDLRASRGQLRPAALDPATPHLHSALCAPVAGPAPYWNAYLSAVWPDPEVRDWALRVMAASVTGYPDAALPVFYGPERTGKSSFVALVMKMLGSYAHAADPRLLGAANAHASIVYALKGRRLSFIDEGPRRGQLATERLKQLTGGTELTGNAMNQNPITFAATHTLVMTTNDEPLITDAALAARMRIIPCEGDQGAVRAARAALTPAVLAAEAPAILAHLIFEAAAWLEAPDTALNASAPVTVREMVAEISGAQDVFAAWLRERTRPSENGSASHDLYRNFVLWYRDNPTITDKHVPSETAWGRAVTQLGYPSRHTRDGKRRDLTLSGGGDVSWAISPVGDGSVTGHDGFADGTRHTETPSSPPVSTPSVTGVTGLDSSSGPREAKRVETEQNTATSGNPSPRHTRHAPEAARQDPEAPGFDPYSIKCGECPEHPGLTKAGKLRAHKNETGFKCEGSGKDAPGVLTLRERKANERAAAATAKVLELAGPLLTLPAAMRRGEGPREVDLVAAAAILDECLRRNGGRLSVDVETNGLPMWHPEWACQTIQLGDWAEAVDLDAADPEHRALATRYLAAAAELEAYSYTADLAPLARIGVIEYDAALAKALDVATIVKLTDPALTENGDGLKETSKAVLGAAAVSPAAETAREAVGSAAGWIWQLKPDTPREKNGWAQIDKRCTVMVTYALADVLDNSALRLRLPQPDPAVMAREIVAERVVAKLPFIGLALDGPGVRAQLQDREPRALAKLTRIRELGVDNPDSPKQVTARLIELGAILPRTKPSKTAPEGNPTAKADVLEKLKHAPGELGELATTLLEYRDDATVLKNMIRPWARSTEHGDGRTYPTIYTLGADTGRMSCVRPNLQQVAREGGLRECIVADPGMLLIAADFSSVEVRVAAYLSGDQNLIAMVNQGVDLHGVIAEHAYGPGWTKAQRYNVKSVVFGRIYGGGVATLAAQSGLTHEMTQRLIDILDAIAPGLRAWSDNLREAIKNGLREFRTYSGRVIHLDPRLPHKGPNFAIQGTARELLVDALIRWEQGPYAGGIVLPVHDEIVAMVPAAQAVEATAYLERCMVTQLGPVPITVEADEPSERWQSAA